MSNRNAVVADHDFLDEHTDDVLAALHVHAFDVSAKTLEEFAQCVSESQIGGLIDELCAQRFEFGLQRCLTLAQLGHSPAQLIQAE